MDNRNGAPPELLPTQHAPSARFRLLIGIALASLLLGGCASPGEPHERKPVVPAAVTDLAAGQSGNDVVLTFTLPKGTEDRRPLERPAAVEIYRDFEALPGATEPNPSSPANPTLLVTIPAAMEDRYAEQGRIRYADALRAEDFAKHPDSILVYSVRTRASEKKSSSSSNVAEVRVYPAAVEIRDLKAEVTRSAVVLTWSAPQTTLTGSKPSLAGYRIYRADADSRTAVASSPAVSTPASTEGSGKLKSPLARIGESDGGSTMFQDQQFEFGKTYVYSVRSVAQYPGEMLESSDSNLITVAPRNTFPPAAPQGLVVVLVPTQGDTPAHLELSWAISPEADVAGYNVYRSEQDGILGTRQNTEMLPTPAFRDINVLPGHRYFYRVTALDRSGNESSPGEAVSGGVPAESQPTP
ncbi:MAG TPA: fibronectin type III domain-containing protein [Candidatus Acidoferrales bacterium]|nr:fibronectin type III domain-containing protein [Candidatus Acidoferrales bacterium]